AVSVLYSGSKLLPLQFLCHRLDTDAQDHWPGNLPRLLRVCPCDAKLVHYLFQWIAVFLSNESLRRRPGSKIAQQMIEIPRCCHFEFGWIDLVKRKGKIGDPSNALAFRPPETTDHLLIISAPTLIY